ncbi:uncharacterized protein F4807DRAFT_461833 [Annulohypoxylon truncatum]|uniref:uncharacterized protein n=1 Tax=Annulohypoxylon truncatum TaxID=327061 RepID=UPI00200889AC|nr:uncharacterized protein F4807DRAFT_461833 [Annulohypoxylon truncatum]KAI1208508.1 hypothetical protein F4807DRAFT_461833 [Annulohypoxylon truncatum]
MRFAVLSTIYIIAGQLAAGAAVPERRDIVLETIIHDESHEATDHYVPDNVLQKGDHGLNAKVMAIRVYPANAAVVITATPSSSAPADGAGKPIATPFSGSWPTRTWKWYRDISNVVYGFLNEGESRSTKQSFN